MFSPHPYGHQYATIVRKLLQVDIKVVELLLHTAMCTAKRRREKKCKNWNVSIGKLFIFERSRKKQCMDECCEIWTFFVFCGGWHSIRFMIKMSGHPQHLHNSPFWVVTGFLPLFLSLPVHFSVDNIAATIELPHASNYFFPFVVLYRIYHLTISVNFLISAV